MSAPPKMKPPPDGDVSRADDIIVTQFVFGAIATVVVALRFYVRAKMVRKIGWDDWLVLLAWAVTVVGIVFNCIMVQHGFGRHQFYAIQKPQDFLIAMKYWTIWPPTFMVSVCLIRISICLFLLRIFNVKPAWRYGLYGMIVFILITNIPAFVFVFVQCKPFEKSWNQKVPGKCWGTDITTPVGLYNGIIAVIIDWTLASLPIAFLWDMQLSIKAKVGVCALIGMGYFTGITAIVRTVITKKVISQGRATDFTWIGIDLRVWGQLELLIGIIAACIPAVKPLYAKAASSLYYSWSKSRSSRNAYLEQHNDDSHQLHQKKMPPPDPYDTHTGNTRSTGTTVTTFAKGGTFLDTNITVQSTHPKDYEMDDFDPPSVHAGTRPQNGFHAV